MMPGRSTALESVAVAVCATVYAVAFTFPILARLHAVSTLADSDQVLFMRWAPYYSVFHYHQLPLWNPYECGGVSLWGNPQAHFLSPFFLLDLLFGPVVGFHLEITLHLAIAWSGGYALARVQGLSPLAAALCGSIFAGSSWYSLHLAEGHGTFLTSAYLPWILTLLWRGFSTRRFVPSAAAGLFIALTLGEGGVYQVPQAFLMAALVALAVSAMQRNYWPLVSLIVFVAFSVGFSAVRLVPDFEMMRAYPRPWIHRQVTPLHLLLVSVLSRYQAIDRPLDAGQWGFWEYGAYVGFLALAFAIIGATKRIRAAVPWLVVTLAFFVLAIGQFGSYAPWSLLHRLPIFSSSRIPSRFLVPTTLAIGVLAAFGGDFVVKRFGSWGLYAVGLALCAVVIDYWLIDIPNFRLVVDGTPPVVAVVSAGFNQVRDVTNMHMYPTAMANEGSLNCYEYWTRVGGPPSPEVGSNEPAYRGEQYLLGSGIVRSTHWTPNEISFEVDALAPEELLINQNYDASWQLTSGRGQMLAHEGLLAISLPAGKQTLTTEYVSWPLRIGAAISIVTLLVGLGLWIAERRIPGLRDEAPGLEIRD
jgi:hypothetical protein